MVSCKTMIHNAYLLEQYICVSGIKTEQKIKSETFQKTYLICSHCHV